MENQKSVFTDSGDSDNEYVIKSKGHKTYLSCGLLEREASLFVPESGPPDKLCGVVNEIFKELIGKLFSPEITVENDLEKRSKTCDTPVRKGGRRRSFRISARPRGLCATLLWREVLIRKLPLNITEFSKKIGVPRTTVLCVFKQLDDYKGFAPSKVGRPRKKKQ